MHAIAKEYTLCELLISVGGEIKGGDEEEEEDILYEG